ncbi:transcriptional regulator, AbrB family [Clostridium sp. DL-VIII]|uniref:AbrB/MazE/SpoVT family DNA-binding domain-containing protein n=1 Tax=Clostridium sp. DL-VIII TaxID=641107 RepID=UPI00023AF9BE|nr:AbrB/MazE/SpoVT family DNA-binding domain-containing protein [Clostridium sp. DL-VIII]EHI98739.1 transcriptional regulator, AbrB family [Clostridium sp. DL-VIII]
MKASGIVRNLDNLGRVVIPKEMRNLMAIKEGDPVEIIKVNNEVVVRKYSKGCIFCGSSQEISEFKEIIVCNECRKALGQE